MTALGWFVTKHAIGTYSTTPPPAGFRLVAGTDVQPRIDALPRREPAGPFEGVAVVEATSVMHDRAGAPTGVIATLLTDDGRRVLATTDDADDAGAMVDEAWEGRKVPRRHRRLDQQGLTVTTKKPPTRTRTLWWGFTLRCPRCGSGKLFRHYFSLVPDCPRCGLHFEREQGYFAGALAINIMAVGGLITLLLVPTLILTAPDIAVVPIIAVLIPVALLGPVVFYPFSKTIWMAVDHAFLQRLDRNERLDDRL